MTTNNDDYVLARWRDAISDPPDDGWRGEMRGGEAKWNAMRQTFRGHPWWTSGGNEITISPGDQWLDVTTVPGVAREAVQAAILEMRGQPPFGCDTWEVALDILQAHCGIGVTPSVVKESLTTETEVSDA